MEYADRYLQTAWLPINARVRIVREHESLDEWASSLRSRAFRRPKPAQKRPIIFAISIFVLLMKDEFPSERRQFDLLSVEFGKSYGLRPDHEQSGT